MCVHNDRLRTTKGFYCGDCETFFTKESPTYRSTELLTSIWMVLNNINAQRVEEGLEYFEDVKAMKAKIGIGEEHGNYEELIAEAENVMNRYGKDAESASLGFK